MKKITNFSRIGFVVLALVLQACVSVALQGDHIISDKNVVFQPNSDHIKESFLALISPSGQILRQVADILKNHHEITRIRIEGHTDATGTAARNQELSTQ